MFNWLDSFLTWASAPWNSFWKWIGSFWFFQWLNSGLKSVEKLLLVFSNAIEAPLQFMVNYSDIIILTVFSALILICLFVEKKSFASAWPVIVINICYLAWVFVSGFLIGAEGQSSIWVKISNDIVPKVFIALILICVFILSDIRKLKTLTVCGVFMALNIVLDYFAIKPSQYIEIGFGSITLPVIATLYGPITACAVGLTQDVVKCIVHPTGGYIPILTILAGMGGLYYGSFFYGKKVTFGRAVLAKLVVNMFHNSILYSIALAPTMKNGIVAALPARILKNVIMWLILAAIIYYLINYVQKNIPKRMYY